MTDLFEDRRKAGEARTRSEERAGRWGRGRLDGLGLCGTFGFHSECRVCSLSIECMFKVGAGGGGAQAPMIEALTHDAMTGKQRLPPAAPSAASVRRSACKLGPCLAFLCFPQWWVPLSPQGPRLGAGGYRQPLPQ